MKQKIGALFLTTIMFSLMFSTFVSAGFLDDVAQGISNVFGSVSGGTNPFLKYFLGDTTDPELFLVKVLFFIVILSIVYYATRQVPNIGENTWLTWTIATVLAILGVRYLSQDALIEFIWLPTGVLGIALAIAVPFIIFFFFIESFNTKIVRKVGWAIFGVIYFGMAAVRWDEFKDTVTAPALAGFNLGWLYLLAAILALLAIILDRPIRKLVVGHQIEKALHDGNVSEITNLQVKIQDLTTNQLATTTTDAQAKKLQKQIDRLEKRLKDIQTR